MNRFLFFFLGCLIFYLATDNLHAAGMIMRVQQMKAQKQQQAQEQEQQYLQAQQQGGNQPQNQQAPAPPTYQQNVDARNQAIAQAIIDAHNPSISTGVVIDQTSQQTVLPQQSLPSASSTDVKDVVDLSEVWKKLDKKSTVWTLLIDDQAKVLTVSEYIDRFHKQGAKISAPPENYVQMIDQIVTANPQMLERPFGELIQILAIIDYDFDNGMNKDDLARKVLGEQAYEANKQRFSQQQQQH